jgi:endonuclease I
LSPASATAGDDEVRAALVNLEANESRPYYDRDTDLEARQRYYEAIDPSVAGASLRAALTDLVRATHLRQPAYKPTRMVYPWVDLHPDRQLRSIYSGTSFAPETLIHADADVDAARFERSQALIVAESALDPQVLMEELSTLEAALPYNCEHVVPQSWFAKREPMRGDLHHLFACESGCNSFRGSFPYFDFTEREEVVRHSCGRREPEGFEPTTGKGPVARATLYFLLRYPGLVGDAAGEFPIERLPILLAWHEADPVGDYEHHRNAAIAEIQGDRNPLIDHPEWATASFADI